MEGAIALECADRQGRSRDFAGAVFSSQEEIGTIGWGTFATVAGVGDIPAFEHCMSFPSDSFARISHGRNLARENNITRTPTVWINGKPGLPSIPVLDAMVSEASDRSRDGR